MLNQTSGPQSWELSQSARENLASIEEAIETSSQFFKPKPGKSYVIKMNPQKDKILPVENDRFMDTNGRPIRFAGIEICPQRFELTKINPRMKIAGVERNK